MNKEMKELLLQDKSHFENSFWRSEEVGEKRVSLHIGIVTAAIAGLVAFADTDFAIYRKDQALMITSLILIGLLLLGIIIYLRILKRNDVTDEYKKVIKYVRRQYLKMVQFHGEYDPPLKSTKRKFLGGGLSTIIATVNTIVTMLLTAVLARSLITNMSPFVSITAGSIIGVAIGISVHVAVKKIRDITIEKEPSEQSQYFRSSVGAVIINDKFELLSLERRDVPGAWQLPQGGIKKGEDPLCAAKREIMEETGITHEEIKLIREYPGFLTYELPPDKRSLKTGRGQTQRWFLFKYLGKKDQIKLPMDGEFKKYRWTVKKELIDAAVSFRKKIYRSLIKEFTEIR